MLETYEQNIEKVVEEVVNRRQQGMPSYLQRIQDIARDILFENAGLPKEGSLILYGEQPDPAIVKNTGKSILAHKISEEAEEQGISAIPVHGTLYKDVFGSNNEIFKDYKLLSPKHQDLLSKQTYAFAQFPEQYREKLANMQSQEIPEQNNNQWKNIEESVINNSDYVLLGDLNQNLRFSLENELNMPIGYEFQFSDLEEEAVKNPELYEFVRKYCSITGQENNNLFVIWLNYDNPTKKLDSGYRRNVLQEDGSKIKLLDPRSKQEVYKGTWENLFEDDRFAGISLNAGGRVSLIYALTADGVHVTGGGSGYNEKTVEEWKNSGFPNPILTYPQGETFDSVKGKPLSYIFQAKEKIYNEIGDKK